MRHKLKPYIGHPKLMNKVLCLITAAAILFLMTAITYRYAKAAEPTFNVTEIPLYTCQYRYIGEYWITGYVPGDPAQCGKSDGIGASGKKIIPGEHAAMKDMPFGTNILVVGLGEYEVADRGVGPGVVDVACEDNAACFAITGHYAVYVVAE